MNQHLFFFFQSVLRFHGSVYLRTLEVTQRPVKKNIPVITAEMFRLREGRCSFRGLRMFQQVQQERMRNAECVGVGGELMGWTLMLDCGIRQLESLTFRKTLKRRWQTECQENSFSSV